MYLTFEPTHQQQNRTPTNDQQRRNEARLGYSCASEFFTHIGEVAGMNKPPTPEKPEPEPITAHTMRKRLHAVSWYVHSCAGGSTVNRSLQGEKAEQWQKLLDKQQQPGSNKKRNRREQAEPSELAEVPDGPADTGEAAEVAALRRQLAEKDQELQQYKQWVSALEQLQQQLTQIRQQQENMTMRLTKDAYELGAMHQACMAALQNLQHLQQAARVPNQGTQQGMYYDVYHAC